MSALAPLAVRATTERRLGWLAASIRDHEAAALRAWESLKDHRIGIGNDLIAAKALCEHGDWLPWLRREFPHWSHDTAERHMRVAANFARVRTLPADASWPVLLEACKSAEKRARRLAKAAAKAALPVIEGEGYTLHHADAGEWSSLLDAGMVDVVITDPRYGQEYLDDYD